MLKVLSVTTGVFFLAICSASANATTCESLALKKEAAEERLFYAHNAWQNRQNLCEADLNPPQCHEYFKNDYADAKKQALAARKEFKSAGCTR